jgi:arylsulfatase B
MRGTKGSEYDGGHRVPCFLRWPGGGLKPGRDVARVTAHVDLLPTLIELCGLKAPANLALDGASLAPLLRKADARWPDRVLVTDSQRIEHPQKWRKSAVMTDRWRLVNGQELYDMEADPGQKTDVADAHPKVVQRLRAEYEKWWAGVSKRFGEYCETILGSQHENPVCLTCHDWHSQAVPWNQGAVRSGRVANGFWAVEVARAGTYEFALRRWPKEADLPIRERFLPATKARVKIGPVEATTEVAADAKEAVLRVKVPAGKAKLQTWFSGEDGKACGAFYVYVTYAGS